MSKRVLILGGDGMLGHALLAALQGRHRVLCAVRKERSELLRHGPLFESGCVYGVDVRREADLLEAFAAARPEVVINAVGIVKQRHEAHEAIPSLEVNALLPHRLSRLCRAAGARLVHLSTDCVFSGSRGNYSEADPPDPQDLYGRTKLLGEVSEEPCLTLRTSIIGLELSRKSGLVEWFLAQRGVVKGYRKAIYTGLTTREMARALEALALGPTPLSGLFHLAAAPIDKYELLQRLSRLLGRSDVTLVPDDQVAIDRSLDGRLLQGRTSYRVPSWDQMLDELAGEIRRRGQGT